MLYVFDVARGYMLSFDAKLAFHNVANLKEEIDKKCNIRPLHQVLLMKGGGSLELEAQISSYSTGTDANPVYLFNKSISDTSSTSSSASSLNGYDDVNYNLQNRVYDSAKMPADLETLLTRIQIAELFSQQACEQSQICEKLVSEQHFQQQGWSAIIAHLEDSVQNCEYNAELLANNFDSFIADYEDHVDIIKNLNDDANVLQKIPLLSALQDGNRNSSMLCLENSMNVCDQNSENYTLMDWISSTRLQQLAEHCSRGLKKFDNRTMACLKHEIDKILEAANEQNLKEIKRVCDRLYSLELVKIHMKKIVQEQTKLAQKFKDDHDGLSQVIDEDKISEWSSLHNHRLLLMLQNHTQLREIWRHCANTKEKLCFSIQRRLERIVKIEDKLAEINQKIILYNNNLKHLCNEIEILKQVRVAPEMYVNAVIEVVRRKNFSQSFLAWTKHIAKEMQFLHNQELDRRREFQSKFEGHFLNELFIGFEDNPPPFATEIPTTFDDKLPNLTIEDLNTLKKQLPNLDVSFTLPNLNTTAVAFFSKSIENGENRIDKEKKYEPTRFNYSITDQNNSITPFNNSKIDVLYESDINNSKVFQSFDETLKVRTRRLSDEGYGIVNEFELLDFKSLLLSREEKIRSLKSLIVEKESDTGKDHLLDLMKRKLIFEQESMLKLRKIYKEIEVKRKQAEIYQHKLIKEAKQIKVLESLFKHALDKFERKSKQIYD